MSKASKLRLIGMARRRGMTDEEILREVAQNVFGGNRRRKLVIEWGDALGLAPSDALRLAFAAGLIPSVHPPRDAGES